MSSVVQAKYKVIFEHSTLENSPSPDDQCSTCLLTYGETAQEPIVYHPCPNPSGGPVVNHFFHKSCLKDWIHHCAIQRITSFCPMCKLELDRTKGAFTETLREKFQLVKSQFIPSLKLTNSVFLMSIVAFNFAYQLDRIVIHSQESLTDYSSSMGFLAGFGLVQLTTHLFKSAYNEGMHRTLISTLDKIVHNAEIISAACGITLAACAFPFCGLSFDFSEKISLFNEMTAHFINSAILATLVSTLYSLSHWIRL